MNRRVGVIAVVITAITFYCALVTPALAQEETYLRMPHRVHLFVEGGIGIPAQPGTFNHFWNTTVPVTIGVGVPVRSWLDINGAFTYAKFGLNSLAAKDRIGVVGTQEVTGGAIKTTMFWGSARFLAVPSARANPFFQVGVGAYNTTAEQLEVEGVLTNTMEDASGISVSGAMGIQYALGDVWSSYAKLQWTANLSDTFSPEDLLLQPGEAPAESGEDQMFSAILVGMVLRF